MVVVGGEMSRLWTNYTLGEEGGSLGYRLMCTVCLTPSINWGEGRGLGGREEVDRRRLQWQETVPVCQCVYARVAFNTGAHACGCTQTCVRECSRACVSTSLPLVGKHLPKTNSKIRAPGLSITS